MPAAVGPVIYYEVLDALSSKLMERRLDGQSLPRLVAERTDAEYGRTWIVDPAGRVAIAAIPGHDQQVLAAVAVATAAPLWSITTPIADVGQAVWAADGRRLAVLASGGDGPPKLLVIDVESGQLLQLAVPGDVIVQGFASGGDLVLRQRLPSPDGLNVGWRFLVVRPGAAAVTPAAALPDVGPATDAAEDVDPAAGIAIDQTLGASDAGTALRMWPLGGGATRILATVPSVDKLAIDPTGTGVAISSANTIRFIGFDGRATDLFSGAAPIADFKWSDRADYLAIATDRRGPNITILERASGRSVELPGGSDASQFLIVRIVGGTPLPAAPLPATEPSPTPTAAPSGADVAAFNGALSGWVDRTGSTQIAHVERLVPTADGGLRVAAAMPPLDLGPAVVPDDGGPTLRILPRPESGDVLIWIWTADRVSGWLWDGAATRSLLPLPVDWPRNAFDVVWRPDGQAIAATAGRVTRAGFEDIFVIVALGARRTTVVPIVGDYNRLEGWWSATELRVGHGICVEGCSGRYAYDARLRVRDHHLVQMTPADRSHAPIDHLAVSGSSIVLSIVNDATTDDIVVDWPPSEGPTDGVEPIGFAGDGRTLLLAAGTAAGTNLIRIADPIGRAVGGRLADPQPERLAQLDGRNLRIDVSPDQGWAIVIDRVDNIHLVRLADGRSWPIDRDRTLVWP